MTKPARNGRYIRQRGYRFENEVRLSFVEHGLDCRRVPLSGAGDEKGDIALTTGWGQVFKGECKIRKALPAYLVDALDQHDFAIFREDRGRTLVLISMETFKGLCQ